MYTQYADIIGIVGFSFTHEHISIAMKHKRTKKCVEIYTIKNLNEIIEDKYTEEKLSEDSEHVMVIFGNLNNLRRNNFKMTKNIKS